MDLQPSPEQHEIIDSSAAFLAARLPIARTRSMFATAGNVDGGEGGNVDDDAWVAAAGLDWFSLGLPELYGGIGCGLADEALLVREIGRLLASGPFVPTMLAARAAAFAGLDDLCASIVAGATRVGLAIPGAGAVVSADGVIDGAMQLLDADGHIVLVATPDVAALLLRSSLTDVTAVPCIDPATRLWRATAHHVAPLAAVHAAVDPIERRAHVLVAAMLTGITEAVRDIAAEHAKNRVQFDKPIGVNQAIKHPCADIAVRAELSFAQLLFAALATDEGRADADFHALSAHLVAADAAELSTAATIQILGGMGFTFEHDAHLFAKRAHVLSQTLGGTSAQLGRVLDLRGAQ